MPSTCDPVLAAVPDAVILSEVVVRTAAMA
jgi:hypothetical protein